MSNLNFGTYDSENTDVLNDPEYGYLLQDDLFIMDSSQKKVVKDLYVKNGQNWSQVKEAYIYDQGQWKVSYRKAFRFKIDFTDSTMNLNLLTYLRSLSTPWDGVSPIKGIFRITNTGVIGSNNSTIPSLMIPTLPANSSLIIINDGSLYGQGGNGGNGANASDLTSTSSVWVGANGGDCLVSVTQHASTKIYYTGSGKIWAGGGGGGGGAENGPIIYVESSGGDTRYCQGGGGGGGGQGYSTSSGGNRSNPNRNYGNAGSSGGNGGFNSFGFGGAGGSGNAGTSPEKDPGGTGGNGGAWGQKGQTAPAGSDSGDDNSSYAPQGGAGGEGGYIIKGPIVPLIVVPTPTNGYVDTDLYKGRV
jgi:hypothetical protein